MQNQKQYHPAIDILRIISILGVVCIHTTTRTIEAVSFDLQRIPWTLFLNQASRFAVPMFFMISGFVLELNYPFHTSYGAYLRKRLNRILIPYIFWSGIYYFLVYTHHTENFFKALTYGDASYQLYFIPTLIIFYLIFPLIHTYYRVLSNKWIVITLGIVQLILLWHDYYVRPLPLFYPLHIALLNYYIFFLGIIAAHHKDRLLSIMQKWKFVIVLLACALAGYIFWESMSLYLKSRNYLDIYSQWRPGVFFYTISLGALLYYFFRKGTTHFHIVRSLARLSFFVFFIHVIVIELTWYVVGNSIFQQTHKQITQQLWFDPLFFLLVAAFSFLVAYAAHKIPTLAKFTG